MLKTFTVDPKIKAYYNGKHSDLIEQPVIIRVNKFSEEASEKFSQNMSKAHDTGQSIIPIIVDSYGGQVYSLLSMISEIQNAKLPVATICESNSCFSSSVSGFIVDFEPSHTKLYPFYENARTFPYILLHKIIVNAKM